MLNMQDLLDLYSLKGKVALVTGAASPGGLGEATARHLHQLGADVFINDIREKEAIALQTIKQLELTHTPVLGDVGSYSEAKAMIDSIVAQTGKIDILVNNAGIAPLEKTLINQEEEVWEKILKTNLGSIRHMTKAAAIHMKKNKYGRIVNFSSIVGQEGNVGQGAYAAAKSGILGLTRTAAIELGKYNITVNAVCPGFIESPMTNPLNRDWLAKIEARTPLGRRGKPLEIAKAVISLITNDFVTGHFYDVNGGLNLLYIPM
jgi:NAD(P)-dependent dehydrogenase (short-subunit alcohol dehydrogenase family)